MKLVLFNDHIPGALSERGIIDLSNAVGAEIMAERPELRMQAIIEQWSALKPRLETASRDGTPLTHTPKLRAPLPKPGKMLFAAGNYNEGLEGITFPIDFFVKAPSSILDPEGTIEFPAHDAQLFFHEAELGFVIGKRARNVSAENALDHVFGYTCINDVSTGGLPGVIGGIRSKCFDTFCPIGPCITTADDIPDPHELQIRMWIDEALRQNYNTNDMEHRIPALIEWLSAIMTLEPGDLIACGTNHHGIGPIQHGEVIRLEIDGIGQLRNDVNDAQQRRWPVGPDHSMTEWVKELKTTGKVSGPPFQVQRIA